MDALEALKKFKATGETKEVKRFKDKPSLKFNAKGGEYVIGKLVKRRILPEGTLVGKSALDLSLIETNGRFTLREGSEYIETTVAAGDVVTVFAPGSLDSSFEDIAEGTEVYIRCDGKVASTREGKKTQRFNFDVRTK